MLANLTAVALFGAAWWIRGGAASRPDAIVLGLEVLGLGLLGAGGYMGGTLPHRHETGLANHFLPRGAQRRINVYAVVRHELARMAWPRSTH
jgi:hypothetical protein